MSSFYLFYKSNKYLLKDKSLFTITDNIIETIIGVSNVDAGIKTTLVNDDTGIQAENIDVVNNVTYESFNEAPYINTEYYDPIHYLDEDLIIQYYVMDYTQEDYFLDKHVKYFLVEIDFNGTIFRRKVKAGNHTINLGKPSSIGETYFSIGCIDLSNNYESAKHYKHLLVVDKNTYYITEEQTYTMTEEDLTTYLIVPSIDGTKITDEEGASNITGINNLLSTVRTQGYRKIVFYNPNGDSDNRYTYYLQPYDSRDNAIIIPNGLTVDLNSCKWKQLVSYGSGSLLAKFENDSNDSHLINGYLWGDYDEHIVDKTADNYPGTTTGIEGEGYNLISLAGAFNSLENIDHAYGTGYSICGGGNNSCLASQPIQVWENKYVNNEGIDMNSNNDIWTSDYYELTDEMKTYRYLQGNPYGGYAGLCGKANDEIVIYYDTNKSFIKKEKIRQYGLSLIPTNAKYVRFTLTSDTEEGIKNVTAPGFRIECKNYKSTTCWKCDNVYSHDCRTVAYATGVYNHLLLTNCKIENCGQWLEQGRVTPLAIDIEDGYQHSEAYYIENLTCATGEKGSNIVNLVTTYDVHMYGENKCNLYAHKTFGLNLHDSTITGELFLGRQEHMRTGFMEVYNCILGGYRSICTDNLNHPNTLLKNCEIDGQINTYSCSNTQRVYFKNCIITRQPRGNISVSSENHLNCICNINQTHYMSGKAIYNNCILNGSGDMRISSDNTKVEFNNCDIYTPYVVNDVKGIMTFNKCKLYNSNFETLNEQIILNNCEYML
ncbi:MAG: hypothetical protein ACI3T9_04185 [Romboutsia timonensis]